MKKLLFRIGSKIALGVGYAVVVFIGLCLLPFALAERFRERRVRDYLFRTTPPGHIWTDNERVMLTWAFGIPDEALIGKP